MPSPSAKKWTQYSLALSVLLHLLLFLTGMVFLLRPVPPEKTPQLYHPPVQSYVYRGAITPSFSHQKSMAQKERTIEKMAPTQKTAKLSQKIGRQQSILEMSREIIHQDQMESNLQRAKNTEPILLIGDEHSIADPLIKLLGRALSAHFRYPKMEGSFGVRGRVYVEMVFHPEGYFTDVSIVQSSNNQDFDAAALYAVNTAPKVIGADHFLSKPKYFVVGFVFN